MCSWLLGCCCLVCCLYLLYLVCYKVGFNDFGVLDWFDFGWLGELAGFGFYLVFCWLMILMV